MAGTVESSRANTERIHILVSGRDHHRLEAYQRAHGLSSETDALVEMIKVSQAIWGLLQERGLLIDPRGRAVPLPPGSATIGGTRRWHYNVPSKVHEGIGRYQAARRFRYFKNALLELVEMAAIADETISSGGVLVNGRGNEAVIVPLVSPRSRS